MELSYRRLSLQAITERAATQDPLFLTRFAKKSSENQTISNFQIVVNEGLNNYHPFHVLRHDELLPADDSNYDNEDNDSNNTDSTNSTPPQQLLECHIVGEIQFTVLNTYGDWVPANEYDEDVLYPTELPGKAAHIIRLKVPEIILDGLKIINNAVKDTYSTENMPISEYYGIVDDSDVVTIKSKLLMHRKEWKRLQDEKREDGDEYLGNSFIIYLFIYLLN
jgi:hypothetical protein